MTKQDEPANSIVTIADMYIKHYYVPGKCFYLI